MLFIIPLTCMQIMALHPPPECLLWHHCPSVSNPTSFPSHYNFLLKTNSSVLLPLSICCSLTMFLYIPTYEIILYLSSSPGLSQHATFQIHPHSSRLHDFCLFLQAIFHYVGIPQFPYPSFCSWVHWIVSKVSIFLLWIMLNWKAMMQQATAT